MVASVLRDHLKAGGFDIRITTRAQLLAAGAPLRAFKRKKASKPASGFVNFKKVQQHERKRQSGCVSRVQLRSELRELRIRWHNLSLDNRLSFRDEARRDWLAKQDERRACQEHQLHVELEQARRVGQVFFGLGSVQSPITEEHFEVL